VLACALAAAADAIVSGDHHLLQLAEYQTIPIRTPAQLVADIPKP
jgi:predicted nucleic acid-binding protein